MQTKGIYCVSNILSPLELLELKGRLNVNSGRSWPLWYIEISYEFIALSMDSTRSIDNQASELKLPLIYDRNFKEN